MSAVSLSNFLPGPVAPILVEDQPGHRARRVASEADLGVHLGDEEFASAFRPQAQRVAARARPSIKRPVARRYLEIQSPGELVDTDVWRQRGGGQIDGRALP